MSTDRKAAGKPRRQPPKQEALLQLAKEIDSHLGAIRQKMREPLEATFASGGGVTGPQRIVMQALIASDGLSLKELSARVSLAHSTVSGIVDRLEARGMLERRTSDIDRRAIVITISEPVRDFLANQMPALAISPLVEALRHAAPADNVAILRGLRKLRVLLEKQRPQAEPSSS